MIGSKAETAKKKTSSKKPQKKSKRKKEQEFTVSFLQGVATKPTYFFLLFSEGEFSAKKIRALVQSFNKFGQLSRIADILADAKFESKYQKQIQTLLSQILDVCQKEVRKSPPEIKKKGCIQAWQSLILTFLQCSSYSENMYASTQPI